MDRKEFMKQLSDLLRNLPPDEKQEALEYYENYFDDAGAENEEQVLRELGSPQKVADTIKTGMRPDSGSYAQYTEQGYTDRREEEARQVPRTRRKREGLTKARAILILILLVFLSPFLKGIFGGALGIIITILLLPFLLAFAVGAGVVGIFVAVVACIVAAVGLCFSVPAAGILTFGIGLLLLAVGLALLTLIIWLIGKVIPALLRVVTGFFGNLLHRRKGDEAI